jgi:O-antigen/teichoic acid export membrane protein
LPPESRTLRSFAGLAGGEAVARALSFVAMLIVARRLGPAMYGVIGVASGIMLYLNQVVDAGVELSGVPAVARLGRGHALAELVASALGVRTIIAIAMSAVVVVIGIFAFPQPDGAVLALYSIGLVFVAAGTRWVYLGLQEGSWVALARISGELSALILIVLALRDVGDIAIVPIATVAGAAVGCLVMLAGLRRHGVNARISGDRAPSREMIARGPHLVGFTVLGLVLFNADLIYLRFVAGQAPAGYYAAAYTFIAFAANLAVTWAHSVLPSLAKFGRGDANRNEVYATAMLLAFIVSLPIAIGGMLTAKPLIDLVYGNAFAPAAVALVWLLPAIPLSALREVGVAGLLGSADGERFLIRTNAMTAAVNIALIIPVVPRYGMVGAAAVTVITEVLRLALTARYAIQHGFELPRLNRFLKPLAAGILMAGGLLLIGPQPLVLLVLAGAVLYAVGLTVMGVLRLERPFAVRLSV